jgi:hypothetical protein
VKRLVSIPSVMGDFELVVDAKRSLAIGQSSQASRVRNVGRRPAWLLGSTDG